MNIPVLPADGTTYAAFAALLRVLNHEIALALIGPSATQPKEPPHDRATRVQ